MTARVALIWPVMLILLGLGILACMNSSGQNHLPKIAFEVFCVARSVISTFLMSFIRGPRGIRRIGSYKFTAMATWWLPHHI